MKRCYILGAGFSKACGLPLANELTAKICTCSSMTFARGEPTLYLDKPYEAFLRRLFPCCDLKRRWPDFEKLLTVLDEWEDYRSSCRNDSDPSVSHFRKILLQGLSLLLRDLVAVAQNADGLSIVKDFVKRIHEEKSSVVSFNWDLLLEVAAQDMDLRVAYACDRWHASDRTLFMAKPHGSLNLVEIPRHDYEEKKQSGCLFGMEPDGSSKDIDSDTVILRDPNPAGLGMAPDAWGPIVVAPTVKKSYGSPWIKQQWQVALHIVQNAEEIFVIGYSLPPTDIRPRLLLQLARFQRDGIAVTFVDPTEEIDDLKRRVGEIMGDPVELRNKPWEEVFR